MQSFEAELRRIIKRDGVQAFIELDDDDDDSVWLSLHEGSGDYFVTRPETRHGRAGFRVVRYTKSDQTARFAYSSIGDAVAVGDWIWDEQYQFYTSIDDFVAAIKGGDYSAGRAAF